MNEIPVFDIRNFTEQLVPNPKEKNKYICPNCSGHNLAIDNKTGAYQCFNGCSNKEVREAIKPWSEVKEELKENVFKSAARTKIMTTLAINKPKEIQQEDYQILTQVYGVDFPKITNLGMERYIDFIYSPTQIVRRMEEKTAAGWKKKPGDKKGIRPWHCDDKGVWHETKGDNIWQPYQWQDVVNAGKGKWVLFVEGEKCVEYARVKFNLVATTFMGSAWDETMPDWFNKMREIGVAGVIMWPDHDKPGYEKAKKVKEICNKLNISYIQLDPLRIWSAMPDKGDIADYWLAHQKQDKKVIWDILVSSIHSYNEEKLDPIRTAIIEAMDKKMPEAKQFLSLYQENNDPLYQQMLKQILIGQGYNQNILDSILSGVNMNPKRPPTVMTGQEFIDYVFPTSGWKYPELVIDCGVQIVSGLPGAMKTTFSYDMGFHYVNNLPFLGEELSIDARLENKKLLIINSDQQSQECQSLIKQSPLALKAIRDGKLHIIGGNPEEEKWNLKYLPWLEEQCKKFRYTMMIIDSYNSIHNHLSDWNENLSTAAQGINALRALAEKYNIAIIVIHHDGKREDGSATIKTRGNTAIPGAASAVMSLTETKEDKNGNRDPLIRFLEISKLRGGACGKMVLKFSPEKRSFDVLPDGNPQNRETLNNIANSLFTSKFTGYDEHSFEDLRRGFVAGVGGDRSLFLARVLTKLEQRGQIQRVMRGDNVYYRNRSVPNVKVEDLI